MDEISSSLSSQRNLLPQTNTNSYQAPAPAVAETTVSKPQPYPWILNPTIDILFSCGGVFWILFALFTFTGSQISLYGTPPAFCLAVVSLLGAHLLGDSHQPATLWRVYFSKTTREKLAVPVTILLVIAIAIGVCTFCIPAATTFFLKLTLAWGFQHQLAQSYGITLVYCYKRKYYMNKIEKNIMFYMVQATTVFLIARMFSLKDFGAYALFNNQYNLPFTGFLPEWVCSVSQVVLQISLLLFVGMVVRKYIKEKQLFPLPAMLTISTLTLMPFFAQSSFIMVWMFISQWFYHSSQYLVITSAFYFKERGLPEGMPVSQIASMLKTKVFAQYYLSIFLFGFATAYLLPMWLSKHGAVSAGVAFAAIFVTLNVHHFITDAFIWRLRDPAIQKLLIA